MCMCDGERVLGLCPIWANKTTSGSSWFPCTPDALCFEMADPGEGGAEIVLWLEEGLADDGGLLHGSPLREDALRPQIRPPPPAQVP